MFAGLIPLYFYQRKHPVNLILLGLWVSHAVSALLQLSLYEFALALKCVVVKIVQMHFDTSL